jgi:hypothetical protein
VNTISEHIQNIGNNVDVRLPSFRHTVVGWGKKGGKGKWGGGIIIPANKIRILG